MKKKSKLMRCAVMILASALMITSVLPLTAGAFNFTPTYYDDDGNEIQLNTGETMICIVEDGDSFQVDNKTIISNRNVTQNKE